jgi:hypothetical protein
VIRHTRHATLDGTAGATENNTLIAFGTVPQNPATAMVADRSHGMNSAFKAIEYVSASSHRYFERFVVIIAADFTYRHGNVLRSVEFLKMTEQADQDDYRDRNPKKIK